MSPKKKKEDKAWEVLVKVTNANEEMERGRLNTSLRAIKLAWESEGGMADDLPREINLRAEAYHVMWPTMTLTPTALAVHWKRVIAQAPKSAQEQALDELRKESK